MIRITRTVLPAMDNPYAVGYLPLGGQLWGICASGSRGISLAFPVGAPDQAQVQALEPANWGAQMFCPADGDSYFAIQGFLPEFQCENSCLVRIRKEAVCWRVEQCFSMPFLHKIAVLKNGGHRFLFCATLSGPKGFKEDWSQPGAVWVSPIPEDPVDGTWSFSRLLYPMTKNHGFCRGTLDGKESLFFSATEGVFAISASETAAAGWDVSKLMESEIGDLSVMDDGALIAAVDGFHGNRFSIYRCVDGRYHSILSTPLTWGHTAWIGRVGNVPVAVAGELEGDARILFFADCGDGFELIHMEPQTGPFSVCPRQVSTTVLELFCPARAAGHPLIYRLELL